MLRSSALLAALATLVACGTTRLYEGPARPREAEAVLHGSPLFARPDAVPTAIDGHAVRGRDFALLPGEHSLTLALEAWNSTGECELSFRAAPGGDYVSAGLLRGGDCRAWLQQASGEVVGHCSCEAHARLRSDPSGRSPGSSPSDTPAPPPMPGY